MKEDFTESWNKKKLQKKNYYFSNKEEFEKKEYLRRKISPSFSLLVWINTLPLSRAHLSLKIDVYV